MTTRAAKSVAADEIAAIEDLMSDLEKRLRRCPEPRGAKLPVPQVRLAISSATRFLAS